VVRVIWQKRHITSTHGWFDRICQVAPVCTLHLIRASLGPPESTSQATGFCTAHGRESVYFTMSRPLPLKIALRMGDLDPHLIHASLGPAESTTQTVSRSVQHFCRLMIVTDQQTDRQTDRLHYSVCNNRPHLLTGGFQDVVDLL